MRKTVEPRGWDARTADGGWGEGRRGGGESAVTFISRRVLSPRGK